ncbi:MAG: transglycosylase SLT domain-containing protein [Sulfitobacter sp.]|nr:transglycosylase SLT domain-containing protein [Sulfitobacter sp.]
MRIFSAVFGVILGATQVLAEGASAPLVAVSTSPAISDAARTPLFAPGFRPPARPAMVLRTRWQHMRGHAVWTRAALSALKDHGRPLVDLVPSDIANWCPAYPQKTAAERRAFWVGFMSALAKHESTFQPWAVGGGGKWYGLLQILPATARGYKCNVGSGQALKNGAANLSCAVRIMAHTVPRDGVIHGYRGRRGRGVTADWGPMHSAAKRRDMAGWLRKQTYCTSPRSVRPRARPAGLALAEGGDD